MPVCPSRTGRSRMGETRRAHTWPLVPAASRCAVQRRDERPQQRMHGCEGAMGPLHCTALAARRACLIRPPGQAPRHRGTRRSTRESPYSRSTSASHGSSTCSGYSDGTPADSADGSALPCRMNGGARRIGQDWRKIGARRGTAGSGSDQNAEWLRARAARRSSRVRHKIEASPADRIAA